MRPFTFQRDTHQTATSSPWQYRSHDEDDSQRRLDALDEGFVSIDLSVKSEGEAGHLRIGVRDSGPGFDVQRTLDKQYCAECLGGRGLRMIRQMSDRFYWQPDGKLLNVEFHWAGRA